MEQFSFDGEYFNYVLMELSTMKRAYDLYPEGFLKEMAQKKGKRTAEIILCPYTPATPKRWTRSTTPAWATPSTTATRWATWL